MNTNKISYVAVALGIISLVLSLLLTSGNMKRMAYVSSACLVYEYIDIWEAHNEYKKKSESWNANIDMGQQDYILAFF